MEKNKETERLNPHWVTGFSDAESCFSFNIQNERKMSSTFKIA
jgi:hypothetical protein